ncbi:uncharacterized protein LOC121916638 isoform X2 [Sceloporus undulatus]|uniref:uncharacterized protein LOC121916638 isoform X2 n=1 Tax=Sceloporus undulatus TaxID=8520 RepID=UPI001C4AAD7F|nr:uncharacterized protein LOC121916638 isoform X2 [Sceloporus undulatus]
MARGENFLNAVGKSIGKTVKFFSCNIHPKDEDEDVPRRLQRHKKTQSTHFKEEVVEDIAALSADTHPSPSEELTADIDPSLLEELTVDVCPPLLDKLTMDVHQFPSRELTADVQQSPLQGLTAGIHPSSSQIVVVAQVHRAFSDSPETEEAKDEEEEKEYNEGDRSVVQKEQLAKDLAEEKPAILWDLDDDIWRVEDECRPHSVSCRSLKPVSAEKEGALQRNGTNKIHSLRDSYDCATDDEKHRRRNIALSPVWADFQSRQAPALRRRTSLQGLAA